MRKVDPASPSQSRPTVLSTKSFTRYEPASTSSSTPNRHRASTLQSASTTRTSPDQDRNDIFSRNDGEDSESPTPPDLGRAQTLPEKFDELPVELASLTDRFVESLSNKSFEQPPSIDHIAELFQEFYIKAASNISIHISSLISRLNRDTSPATSIASSKSKSVSRTGSHESLSRRAESAQQMLTASEVTEKRKARKLLEYKRLLLEEAVERRACEKVYSKIWRHKSTLDEIRDEKLRSKTAALALVGINLKDLGIEFGDGNGTTAEDVQELLVPARDGLMRMNDELHPLGKLQHLTKAHQNIVDTLYAVHGSSSSADEILPTLIYTLITSPVEGINIISNLHYIQRFRTASKVDGEAAYCLTNLEAAISFLETVDLTTLRADEEPGGPRKTPSQPGTPAVEKAEPFPSMLETSLPSEATTAKSTTSATADLTVQPRSPLSTLKGPPLPRHQRTLSDLFQPMQASSEAVRIKANEGIENIANTLDNSLKFLFGRLREQAADPTSPTDVVVPKTLDEARRLVSRPQGPDEDAAMASETSSIAEREVTDNPSVERVKSDDKLMSLFGGRKPGSIRDRSVDSQKSGASSRRVTFTQATTPSDNAITAKEMTASPSTISRPLDSVKNLGSSLNPFNSIGSAFGGSLRAFGRPAMPTAAVLPSPVGNDNKHDKASELASKAELSLQIPVDSPEKIAIRIRAAAPPIRKFITAENVDDFKIKEITELLEDYKRLSALLTELASGQNGDETGKSKP